MKKLNVLAAVFIVAALGAGCGSSPASRNVSVPGWVSELSPEDAFWGIGTAKLDNDALALEVATTRASRDVARQLDQLVQALLTDYAREAGLLNKRTSIVFIENVGRNLVNVNLPGARVNARERTSDGTWWARVSVGNGEIKNAINDVYDNEAAQFAEWKKDEALKRLDAELAKRTQPLIQSED